MSAVTEVSFGRSQLDSLVEASLRVPGLTESHVRDARIEDLRRTLRRPFDPPRSADPRPDLAALLAECAACSGGLRAFARVVHQFHPGVASSRLVERTEELLGPMLLSRPDRDVLRDLIAGITIEQVVGTISALSNASELYTLTVWQNKSSAIRQMEQLAPPPDGVPQVLTFASRLADLVGGEWAGQLRSWVSAVAGGLGVDPDTLTAARPAGPPATLPPPTAARRPEESGPILGGVPIRNRNFTGREELLDRLSGALRTSSTASVLPQALQGLGGVGKTQLVIEFVHRNLNRYDLVWWIPAEDMATVLTSLSQLAVRLGLATAEDRRQTAHTVVDYLSGANMAWLLVYDNANDPADLEQFLPSTGGHVIVTTRIREWAKVGREIEVDVFEREESIELLRKRSRDEKGNVRIDPIEADELAAKLGDLPLALEQAAAWFLATAMPVREYISLLDSHIKDLMSEGKPAGYPFTVAAFVTLAVGRLRASELDTDLATAQLLALFAFLGGEPVPQSLLQRGGRADVSEPLRSMLDEPISMGRIMRDLSRYGLARVDPRQRVQVHRLVQLVMRDTFSPAEREETLRNVQSILAAADPGDPDEVGAYELQLEIGPHLAPADMIHSSNIRARQVVLNHARYLWITGDYENSLRLATQAAEAWGAETWDPRLGPDGQMTLLARGQVANATRTLGDSRTAQDITRDVFDRFRRSPILGPRYEFTLITGNQVGADLRIAGRYQEAHDFDTDSVALHREVFGVGHTYTLRAEANLAVDHRMLGQFGEALELDEAIARTWGESRETDERDQRELFAYMNMARDYYGLGAYAAGLDRIERWRNQLQRMLGPDHAQVLLAGRTYAITLRKIGRLADAAEVIRENVERVHQRFGPAHEFSVAATVSLANLLRDTGELEEALREIAAALDRYRGNFGEDHPLTLVAQVNAAIIHRARGEAADALALDERCYERLGAVLAPDHPYAICAGTSLATDFARAGRDEEALRMSREMLALSRAAYGGLDLVREARDGAEHPYVLMRAINLCHDLRATGAVDEAESLFVESVTGLRRALGPDHPEVLAAERNQRMEGDIEPPPT